MAEQIDRDELRKLVDTATPGPWNAHPAGKYVWTEDLGGIIQNWSEDANAVADMAFIAAARTAVPQLLDALAAAEHRATRAEAQAHIRGRAVAMYRERARDADARIRAVEDVLDQHDHTAHIPARRIHRALADIPRDDNLPIKNVDESAIRKYRDREGIK